MAISRFVPRSCRAPSCTYSCMVLMGLLGLALTPMVCVGADSQSTGSNRIEGLSVGTTIDDAGRMDVNNLDMFVTNHGSIASDVSTSSPGLIYPKGSTRTVIYAAGPWVGAKVNGAFRVAVGAYSQEFSPGPMLNGAAQPDHPAFKTYSIRRGDTTSPDYVNWPVAQGAPTDTLGNPLFLGDATNWSVFNDADPAVHTNIGGSTSPLGLEVQQTVFAYNRTGPLGNTIFVKWKLLNKGVNTLDSTYIAFWSDPDLGGYWDDLVGCDTTLSLGYCYNATNTDGQYGSRPPAVGYCLLRGPIVPGAGGVDDTLGMTSFNRYINGTDPGSSVETYSYMQGLDKDGSKVHEFDDVNQPETSYRVSGDPVTSTGWLDSNPGDRRLMLSSGPFTMAPGDSQEAVFAIIIGQGVDRLASIAALRASVSTAQLAADGAYDPVPTAISLAMLRAETEAGRVRIHWYAPGHRIVATRVDRRTVGSDWALVGNPQPDLGRNIIYEDTDVIPGTQYGYRLVVLDARGEESSSEIWVTVPEGRGVPTALRLESAYPNPFRMRGWLSYGLPQSGRVRLTVYDLRGRHVATVVDRVEAAGWRTVEWDGRDAGGRPVASGAYFARLEAGGVVSTRKIVLAR